MKISRASTYALYGLCYMAQQPTGRFVPLSEIRDRYGLPEKHLAKIFQVLVRGGLLHSSRGVNGGFTLARSPGAISALEVIETIDGPILEDGCLLHLERCEHEDCRVTETWRRAQREVIRVLTEATLGWLAENSLHGLRPPGIIAPRVNVPAPLLEAELAQRKRRPRRRGLVGVGR